jgi:hypothetical protein
MKPFLAWSMTIVLVSAILALVATQVVEDWFWHPSRIGVISLASYESCLSGSDTQTLRGTKC